MQDARYEKLSWAMLECWGVRGLNFVDWKYETRQLGTTLALSSLSPFKYKLFSLKTWWRWLTCSHLTEREEEEKMRRWRIHDGVCHMFVCLFKCLYVDANMHERKN